MASFSDVIASANALSVGPSNIPRLRSPRFQALPWQYPELLNALDLKTITSGDPELAYLTDYTAELSTDESSAGQMKTQEALKKFLDSDPDALTELEIGSAFSILMRYRIVDVALYHAGREFPAPTGPTSALVSSPKLALKRLEDCSAFLNEQSQMLLPALAEMLNNAGTLADPRSMDNQPIVSSPLFIDQHRRSLLSRVVSRRTQQQVHTVLLNFETAAFYLSYLLKGRIDLPQKIGDLLTELSMDSLDGASNRISVQSLRYPLQVAMSVSPLCLLMGKDLMDGPGRKSLFDIWQSIGFVQRPPDVQRVERELWAVVFDVARGEGCVDRLHRAVTSISGMNVGVNKWLPPIVKGPGIVQKTIGAPLVLPSPRLGQDTEVEGTAVRHRERETRGLVSAGGYGRGEGGDEVEANVQVGAGCGGDPRSASGRQEGVSNTCGRSMTPDNVPGQKDDADHPGSQLTPTHQEDAPDDVPGQMDDAPDDVPGQQDDADLPGAQLSQNHRGDDDIVMESNADDRVDDDGSSLRRSSRLQSQKDASPVGSKEGLHQSKRHKKLKGTGQAKVKHARVGQGLYEIDDEVVVIPRPTAQNFLVERKIIDFALYKPSQEIPRLVIEADRAKCTGWKQLEYFVLGFSEPFMFIPRFHFWNEVDWWYSLHDAVLENSRSSSSRICAISNDEYKRLSSSKIAHQLRSRHLLIYNIPDNDPDRSFGNALALLGPLDAEITIHDLSIDVPEGGHKSMRARLGTPLELARSIHAIPPKSLNALDFPLTDDPFKRLSFSSDNVAWRWSFGKPFCTRIENKPITDIRWGLAATSGAFHDFHIDTEGFATFVDPKSGVKLWVIATPKNGKNMGQTDIFFDNYSAKLPDKEHWAFDLIVLKPGMRLIMRPNTVHAVLTPVPSVCLGGHFYATSTIQSTIYGLYHTFVMSKYVTNALHRSASDQLMSRLLTFIFFQLTTPNKLTAAEMQEFGINDQTDAAHLPDLQTFDGLLDLLTLCNYFELHGVICDWTYVASKHSTIERERTVTNRGLARQLVDWVFRNYDISLDSDAVVPRKDALRDIAYTHLARQARALVCYKELAEKEEMEPEIPTCSAIRVKKAVEGVMLTGSPYREVYLQLHDINIGTFVWTGPAYNLRRRPTAISVDQTITGETDGDVEFYEKVDAHYNDDDDDDEEEPEAMHQPISMLKRVWSTGGSSDQARTRKKPKAN